MNALEQQLDYPLGDFLPDGGRAHEVAPGVFWVRMPLPFALNHINLWLLRDRIDGQDGWTIVDCGITHDQIKTFWEQIFDGMLDGLPVLRVIVTHFHPDHLGLAHWLCEGGERKRWQARLWMTLGEYAFGRVMVSGDSHGSNAGGDFAARHFAANGLTDKDSLEKIRARKNYYTNLVPSVPSHYRRLRDSEDIVIGQQRWRVITGFGHAPEHAALHCPGLNVLISGDMVLPRISTNVSVFDIEPESNPVALYLESLGKFLPLPENCLVLPSHGKPFNGLHTRIRQLRDHHAERLQEVRDACAAAPQSAADIVPIMFKRELDMHQMTFALGEALAHLHCLWLAGELVRQRGGDGVWRFTRAA